ncbi:hypothetical protein [Rugamonas aquatica]|uniref:Uncharacterized protein n=1 Tax=Rugamonas aquatica TaxID=2743357 RepID=A0A6A7MVZ0_9BURK|nr:hypothetical protein [Rugamonas aquatica]MQA36714.1 hypothetical protein [Rugamonas aquatica]
MSAPASKVTLEQAAASETLRLAHDPNIVCVGYGLKQVGGQPTMVAALQYHVRSKRASEAEIRALGSTPVAAAVEGYQTDVLPWTMARRTACPSAHRPTGARGDNEEDPLVGGTSTSILGAFMSFPTAYGTLGGICFDASSGASMALSNAHVYGSDTGHDAIQPFTPVSDYVGGAVEWLACGGPLSHLFFWTAPSPLTGILTAAAAGAWVAAAASDAEDPSRWGQRTTTVPAPGVTTTREQIHLEADVPRIPFPGRYWTTATRWDYSRVTNAGATTGSIAQDRPNEHVLVGKRVFTDRAVYAGGDAVRICAQIWTSAGERDPERFVVAHSFPIADPTRAVQRVLHQDYVCARIDSDTDGERSTICLHGFTHQVAGMAQVNFPIIAAPFVFIGEDSSVLLDPGPGNPSGVTALRLPGRPLAFACPPSTHVELKVFHCGTKIHATAISANNSAVDQADAHGEAGEVQTITLSGPEIVRVILDAGDDEGEAYLAEVCIDKRRLDIGPWKGVSTYYTGSFTLPLNEADGKWAVVVVTQSLDQTPTGGDPIQAARQLGGIVDSANVVETGECACEILFDHTFDVRNDVIILK